MAGHVHSHITKTVCPVVAQPATVDLVTVVHLLVFREGDSVVRFVAAGVTDEVLLVIMDCTHVVHQSTPVNCLEPTWFVRALVAFI